MDKKSGYTLVELMIVVAMIGVLAAIGIPNYIEHVKKTNRTKGQTGMMQFAAALERHRLKKGTYLHTGHIKDAMGFLPDEKLFANELPRDSSKKTYFLRMTFTTNTYTLYAHPIGRQAGDGKLFLNHTGKHRWDKNNDAPDDINYDPLLVDVLYEEKWY